MKLRSVAWRAIVGSLIAATFQGAMAAALTVTVAGRGGAVLEDAAVYLEPLDAKAPGLKARAVEIEQKDRRFSQMVTVVQAGQAVQFPNRDNVRHHVYSLSQAKLFELKLYMGVPANPVVFDKPGSIVVGCNIHDKMVAYIHVVDTPWFGKSDAAGRVRIDGMPDGRYRLKVWHYGLANLDAPADQVINIKGDAGSSAVQLDLRPGIQ